VTLKSIERTFEVIVDLTTSKAKIFGLQWLESVHHTRKHPSNMEHTLRRLATVCVSRRFLPELGGRG